MKICPDCSSSTGLRKIAYGIPIFQDGTASTMDESKYVLGGCCVTDDDPTLRCIECGWEGENVNNAPGLGKEIRMVELQDISKMSDSEIDSYAQHIWQKLAMPKKGETDDNSKS